MYTLLLLVVLQNAPSHILQSTHEPFETEQACHDFAAFVEADTNEKLAKMVDQGVPVIDHKMICKKLVDERPV